MLACTFVRSFAQSASSNRECAVTGFLAGTMRMRHIHAVATTAFRDALSILISASASKKNGQLTDQARPGCRTALCTALVCPSRSRLIIAEKKLHHIRSSAAMPPPSASARGENCKLHRAIPSLPMGELGHGSCAPLQPRQPAAPMPRGNDHLFIAISGLIGGG